ncbi:MAG: tRNA uridine-5-carboxymethylaminomethyl(34) synthesis GTPase MnmE [Elusimicrobia bacterium]|nr:tRNA uridine-5-carboxymethylaminomethyl(34) synthesis GTPase MnmE [Elusimicrobiota bacterium]
MNKNLRNDTIVAPITAWGHSSVGIVRLSGNDSLKILEKIFKPKSNTKVKNFKSHTIHYGHIYDGKELVDEVLVFTMLKPKSYTREDVVEISSHGGPLIIKKILSLCIKNGARLAQPGEFTKRAYLNGRIDLLQAEAVADIINAKSEEALKISQRQLKGLFSEKINDFRNQILNVATELNALVDFPEEDISIDLKNVKGALKKVSEEIKNLLKTENLGRIYREGVKIVIAGKTNVGKSTLMNVLSDSERAIVTPIPGTTRDVIREAIVLDGIPVELYDTAGIRKTARGIIEKMGMKKTKQAIEEADLILFLFDASKNLDEKDENIMEILAPFKDKTIMVGNKTDLGKKKPQKKFGKELVFISCLKKTGIQHLRKEIIHHMVHGTVISNEEIIITSVRQSELLKKTQTLTCTAVKKIDENFFEAILLIEEALKNLDSLTGKIFREEMIDEIFSRFCIGK